ncbi:MAG: hypothetical protein IGS48_09560 [Oscillatoriales cyanobacterium C42_A2020_001]|nr:hypothetical protein [Leptolyngbyaceae cyanobacterium C42_A2020_001]
MANLKADAQPDWENTENFDAEVVKEAISEGDQKAPEVDVAADYDAAKEMSAGIVDAKTAEELVKPQFEVESAESVVTGVESNQSPDFMEMAKEVSQAPGGASNVTDDLVEKAIAKGKPSDK